METVVVELRLTEGESIVKRSPTLIMTRIRARIHDKEYRRHPTYIYFVYMLINDQWKRQEILLYKSYRSERLQKGEAERLYKKLRFAGEVYDPDPYGDDDPRPIDYEDPTDRFFRLND
jgi:hypothetical protein